MTVPEENLIVFCTFPNAEQARRIILELVELRLIACGTIFPAVESIYRWQGAIHLEAEAFALLKTSTAAFDRLQSEYKSRHPYEVPELVACPITRALPEYLQWISENVSI
jgi:periplasmic divalent cation tolerance protein